MDPPPNAPEWLTVVTAEDRPDLWEMVRQAEPEDFEAQRKINALAVREHLSKGHYLR